MFKWTSSKYVVVAICSLILFAASALGGWQLGQNQKAATESSTVDMPALKGANNLSSKPFDALQPGKLYGMPEPLATQHTLQLLRQKEAAHQRTLVAEAARQRTRRLVAPDRGNVDCTRMKCLALTYDDGPDKRLGSELLDVLQERKAVATFFVVGNRIDGNEALLKRIVQAKNEIGNHSWSHANLKLLTNKQIIKQAKRTNNAIFAATGQRPQLMRPPYAKRDARVVKRIGMPIALWNIDPEDWRAGNPQAIYRHVVAKARPGGVVVMHEIKDKTIQAAPLIIDELQRQGYVLVTMSELFGITDENYRQFVGQPLYHR